MVTFNLDTNDLDNPKLLGAAIMFFHALGAKLPEAPEGVTDDDTARLASAVEKYAAELKAADKPTHTVGKLALEVTVDTSKAEEWLSRQHGTFNMEGQMGEFTAAQLADAMATLPVVAQVHDETQYAPDAAHVGFGVPQLQAEPNPAQVFGAARSSAAAVPLLTAQGTSIAPSPDASTLVLNIGGAADAPQASAALTNHANGVTLDRDGLPWDGRIHASSKEKVKDGTWKKKRGVVAELVATVETELRRLLAIPSPTTGLVAALMPTMVEALTVGASVAPPPPLAVASSVAAAPASDAPPMTWVTVAQRCASIAASGRATTADVAAIFAANGMKGPADLMARPDFIPVIDAALTAAYGA